MIPALQVSEITTLVRQTAGCGRECLAVAFACIIGLKKISLHLRYDD